MKLRVRQECGLGKPGDTFESNDVPMILAWVKDFLVEVIQ